MNLGFAGGATAVVSVADFRIGVRIDDTNIYITTVDDLSQFECTDLLIEHD